MAFHFREAHRFDPFNTTVSRFINRSGMSKTHLSDVEMVVP